jgi:PhoP regulatory network protein YrbL
MAPLPPFLTLAGQKPFGRGGKRECFVVPGRPELCVKVHRADRLPVDLWRQLPLNKRWRKTVASQDESLQDWRTLMGLAARAGPDLWEHVPKCHGWIETDRGRGLVLDLVRDADGQIARSFLAHLWEHGFEPRAQAAVRALVTFWNEAAIPSRSLGLHNMTARLAADGSLRLLVIDGFGSTELIPISRLLPWYARRRAASRTAAIYRDIEILLARQKRGESPGDYGFLFSRV